MSKNAPTDAVSQAVVDYYRCADNLADFKFIGNLSDDPGYFRFGCQTICYGNSSLGRRSERVAGPLYDTLAAVQATGGIVRLPLDPNEIIENLRYERYCHNGFGNPTWSRETTLIRDVYYWLRPFLPLALRKHLQRLRLKDWRRISFPHWPVDRTVEQVLDQLLALSMKAQGIRGVPFVWFWPYGANSCAIMTHDVEELAGRNFCSQLMDLDDSAGIKASFQLVPEQRYPVAEGLLDEMRARSFEINIHDLTHNGRLFSSHQGFLRWAEQINAYAKRYRALGFRSGGLYRNQDWFGALEFSYDMSVPSVAHLEPQQGGCCSLMPFFIGKILELPLTTIQDYSLFHILNDYSIDLWRRQIDSITEKHGLVSFIVHPDYIIAKRARATYQALLEHLVRMREERGLWIALPREVDRWWRERSQMTVVSDGSAWRIEGRGKERARLAFATLVGDRLAFTIQGQK